MLPIAVLLVLLGPLGLVSLFVAKRPRPSDPRFSDEAIHRWRRATVVKAIVVASLGCLPFVGLPGFAWLDLVEPAVRALTTWPMGRFGANASWPAAMLITAVWPASFWLGYCLVRSAGSTASRAWTVLAALLLVSAWGLWLALAMIVLYFVW